MVPQYDQNGYLMISPDEKFLDANSGDYCCIGALGTYLGRLGSRIL